jgi:hypothetical protein
LSLPPAYSPACNPNRNVIEFYCHYNRLKEGPYSKQPSPPKRWRHQGVIPQMMEEISGHFSERNGLPAILPPHPPPLSSPLPLPSPFSQPTRILPFGVPPFPTTASHATGNTDLGRSAPTSDASIPTQKRSSVHSHTPTQLDISSPQKKHAPNL